MNHKLVKYHTPDKGIVDQYNIFLKLDQLDLHSEENFALSADGKVQSMPEEVKAAY